MSSLITSRSNAQVKRIRGLRSRKEREATGLFWVEGIRLVWEALRTGAVIQQGVVAPELLKSAHARESAEEFSARGIPVLEVSGDVFASLSGKEGPQGIGAVVEQRWEQLSEVRPEGLGWVALVGVQDPGNLGTILRTCDAVGAAGVMLIGPTTDPYDPGAMRASMGAIFNQRLVRASFDDLLTWKNVHGCSLVGTADTAETDYATVAYRTPLLLLMGSEQHGLAAEQQAACDVVVRIPMAGRSDSLNLSVATGVMLYAVYNNARLHRHDPYIGVGLDDGGVF